MDSKALLNVSYGLYVLTAKEDNVDNGCIINTVMQITNCEPFHLIVSVCKQNRTHDMIMKSKEFNVSMLTTSAPFKVFEHFGFQSGKNVNKFAECGAAAPRSSNGIIYIPKHTNSYFSAKVYKEVDCETHTIFVAEITEAEVLSSEPSLTYTYYHDHVKPKPKTKKGGYVCKICNFIYEGDELPANYICPLCKHGVVDFEKIQSKTEYVCKICNFVYEGDELPADYICPLCKHGVADFEKVKPKTGYLCKICNFVYDGDVLPADYICPLCKHGIADFIKL